VRPLAPVLAPVEDASEAEDTPAEAAVVEVRRADGTKAPVRVQGDRRRELRKPATS
jgi:hypothetical protein